ncbi:MAG TPA: FIST N-terminal domain-containing protein [Ilumatobacteraceae bacterium]
MDAHTHIWNAQLGWSPPLPRADERETLVMVFADPAMIDEPANPLADVAAAFRGKAVLGCSTAGQLHDDILSDRSVVVLVATFERTLLRVASVAVEPAGGARRCGRQLGAQLAEPGLRGVLVLSDGLDVNGTSLAAGISEELPGVPISGGLAGDGDRFGSTWVLVDGTPRSGWVTAVGFVGDHVELGFGSAGGWDIFGPERVVTRSFGNVLYELDNKPALSLYRDYLGDRAEGLPATALLFPLSVRDLDGRTTVRTILAVDEATQSLRFAGDVPQGSVAQLMRASNDRLVDGAHRAAQMASTGRERLAIAVSCVGRRLVLGQRTEEEIEAVIEALNHGTSVAGFYSYGELSPTDGTCDLHNQTMTVTTIAESAA